MKNLRLTSILSSSIIASALAFGTLASTPAFAQQPTAKVNIPFAFQVGNDHMAAGTYEIAEPSSNVLLLRGPSAAEFVITHNAVKTNAPDHGSVVFDRYGSKYFLRQVWTAGNSQGIECSKSRAEKEALQAGIRQTPTLVELALNTAR